MNLNYFFLQDKLTFEDHLQSAPAPMETGQSSKEMLLPVTDQLKMTLNSEQSFESDINHSSIESLFRFVDRLVEEATHEAKLEISSDLSLTLSANGNDSFDKTLTPCEGINEPGELIDIYVKRYDKQEKPPISKPHRDDCFHVIEAPNFDRKEIDDDFLHSSSPFDLDFNPLQIETSSVDENSRQTPSEEKRVNQSFADAGTQCEILMYGLYDCEMKNCKHENELMENSVNCVEKIDDDEMKTMANTESSQSVNSDDVADLLAYGEFLREAHSFSFNVSDQNIEEVFLKQDGEPQVEYDESFAVEASNSTIDSKTALDLDERDELEKEAMSKRGSVLKRDTVKASARQNSNARESIANSKYDVSLCDSSLNFDEDLFYNEIHESRLNRTDDGSYASMEHNRSTNNNETSLDNDLRLPGQFRHNPQFIGNTLDISGPRFQPIYRNRSRSLSPRRANQNEAAFSRSASVGKELSRMQHANEVRQSMFSREDLRSGGEAISADSFKIERNEMDIAKSKSGVRKKPPPVLPKPKIVHYLKKVGEKGPMKEVCSCNGSDVEMGNLKKEVNMLREECASLGRQIKVCYYDYVTLFSIALVRLRMHLYVYEHFSRRYIYTGFKIHLRFGLINDDFHLERRKRNGTKKETTNSK